MSRNNVGARRCSYFELGLPVFEPIAQIDIYWVPLSIIYYWLGPVLGHETWLTGRQILNFWDTADSLLRMPVFPAHLSKSLLTSFHAISTSTLLNFLCWWSFRSSAQVPLVWARPANRRSRREKTSPVPPGQGNTLLQCWNNVVLLIYARCHIVMRCPQ